MILMVMGISNDMFLLILFLNINVVALLTLLFLIALNTVLTKTMIIVTYVSSYYYSCCRCFGTTVCYCFMIMTFFRIVGDAANCH